MKYSVYSVYNKSDDIESVLLDEIRATNIAKTVDGYVIVEEHDTISPLNAHKYKDFRPGNWDVEVHVDFSVIVHDLQGSYTDVCNKAKEIVESCIDSEFADASVDCIDCADVTRNDQ